MKHACRELDVAPALRAAPEGPAAGAAAERVGLHGDVDGASATLSSRVAGTSASDVPDVLAPEPALRLLRHQPGPRLGRGGGALREPAQRLLAAAARRRLHAAARTTRRSSSRCSSSATASRTPRTARRPARATCGAATSTPRGSSGSRASCGRARSRSSARRPTAARSASGPSSARRSARSATTALFVLPSTSPANAAVPYAERLHVVPRAARLARAGERAGGARARPRRRRARPARALRERRQRRRLVGDAGRRRRARARPTSRRSAASCVEEAGLTAFELGPLVWTRTNDFAWLGELVDQRERIYLVRVGRARARARRSTCCPRTCTDVAGGRSTSSRPTGERLAPPTLPRACATLLRDGPPAEPVDVGV